MARLFDRTIPLPSSGPWDKKDLIGNPPLPMFVEVVGPAGSLATIMDICGKWEVKSRCRRFFFTTHTDVAIDPAVPIPDWPLNER